MSENIEKSKKPKEPWFVIGKKLNKRRSALLTCFSFLLPFLLWCLVSYTPFIWHPDVKLDLGGEFGSTVYTAGDHVSKDYLPDLVQVTQEENSKILEDRTTGNISGSKRSNLKKLRLLSPLLVKNNILSEDQYDDDQEIYMAWGKVANEPSLLKIRPLSEGNLTIVQNGWNILSKYSPTYDKANFPSQPLLKLLPQGVRANPIFLPAPHEVIQTGIRDWKAEPPEGKPSMSNRFTTSILTVLYGFLAAAAIAIPLGIIGGTYDFFAKILEPFWDFFRYMPAPAFGTLLVAILGVHQQPKVALIFIGTFPHLLLMLTKTVRIVDLPLLEAAQTLGAKGPTLLGRVVVPASLPNIYNDLRIALGWAWTWLVISELIGVKAGLTEVIDTQGVRRNFDRVYPVIILIGIVGFLTDQFLAYLKTKLFPWQTQEN